MDSRRGDVLRLMPLAGLAGLAMLSACSAPRQVATGPSTGYYVEHAAGDYRAPGPASDPWGPYIQQASQRFDVPQQWIRSVMHQESDGQEYIDGQLTVSPAGAMGLMQLEPETYQEMAARYGLGSDPFNPFDNIMAGTAYIHEMYQIYGSPGFLAAYNAGPGRLNNYVENGRPLPSETTRYVAMIAPNIQGYYPNSRSDADQLALNTMPMNRGGGILPAGFSPGAAPALPVPPDIPAQAPVQVAALAPPAQPEETTLAPPVTAVSQPLPTPPPPPVHHFQLIQSAMADTPPPTRSAPSYSGGGSGWAIQVGAYGSAEKAKAAIGIAELSAVQSLMKGQPMVVAVHNSTGTVYRARVTALPHEAAIDACHRLTGGPTGCVVLSPDAQS